MKNMWTIIDIAKMIDTTIHVASAALQVRSTKTYCTVMWEGEHKEVQLMRFMEMQSVT